ncbi:MAG: acetate--CoA ligase family protein [Anaerolineaceae bacterium]
MPSSLKPFFTPSGVAVIGASANPQKLSYGILKNLKENGYTGGIYPVNPGADEILGLRCYHAIGEVPDPLELAVIVVPAPAAAQTIEACGQRGLKAAILITGGFKEVGEGGAALEKQVLEIASKHGMRLIGPNCVGLMNLYTGLNTTFIDGMPDRGGIGFLSQSGAICGGVVDFVQGKKVGFSHFISLGNEADVTETDIIEYLGEDPNVRVIAAYVEQIRDGRRFLEVAKRVSRSKPIVMIKAGRSDAGARAVSSHTGSLAGSYSAYQAAFEQGGVIEVDNFSELFDVAIAFDFQPLPAGPNAVILTNAGGPAALASDGLAGHGFKLVDLSDATRTTLRGFLNPSAQVANPVDMLGGASPSEYGQSISAVLKDANVDIALPLLVPQAVVDTAGVAQAIVDASASSKKPVLATIMGDKSVNQARLILQGNRIPMYTYPEAAGIVLAAMRRYKAWRDTPAEPAVSLPGIDRTAAAKHLKDNPARVMGEAESRPLLESYGIPLVPAVQAATPEEAASAAERLGFPVVMKIVSPQLLHKSDAGGIRLNLKSAGEVYSAFSEMTQTIHNARPDAKIEGVLVEKMAPKGTEVIIGMRRDPGFGPLMMFGLGGIYVELFKDVSFRVAPLTRRDARQMIDETRAGRLLTGFRGSAPADVDAVVEVMLRLSQIALDFPEIDEIEINPLLVYEKGHGALALDSRLIRK